jgi:hypothetical protein
MTQCEFRLRTFSRHPPRLLSKGLKYILGQKRERERGGERERQRGGGERHDKTHVKQTLVKKTGARRAVNVKKSVYEHTSADTVCERFPVGRFMVLLACFFSWFLLPSFAYNPA